MINHFDHRLRLAPEPQPLLLGAPRVRYRRGAPIRLLPDSLLEIVQGVVAQTMLHGDGTEVFLGLYGPEQVLLSHPEDDCCIQLVAQTDVVGVLRNWVDALREPALVERLRTRIQFMEAWAATQARPYLDDRLLGLLGLLAEQFGVPHTAGVVVDVRLTHAQLASAIGATRSTVTRVLGTLRVHGALSTVGVGERERFCLHAWQPGQHLSFPRAATRRTQAPAARRSVQCRGRETVG